MSDCCTFLIVYCVVTQAQRKVISIIYSKMKKGAAKYEMLGFQILKTPKHFGQFDKLGLNI